MRLVLLTLLLLLPGCLGCSGGPLHGCPDYPFVYLPR